ncbi:MAG: Pr6Pr family membrane protein [Bacteroidota bacterium]|nr:Pr6Pr family membrane protein [Bacteroidota bacterium]
MAKRYIFTGYRIFFGLLAFSAVVTEMATLIERNRFVPFNFFSFFTIESNLFAVVVFMMSSLWLEQGKQEKRLAMLRGASTLYMAITGIVFSLLLSGLDVELTAVPWDNTVLHYIMPLAVAAYWLIDPLKERITFTQASSWLVFPIVYVLYTLIRGHFVNWYPYPFLNPNEHGYIGVAITSIAIALGAAALVWVLTLFTGRDTAKKMR